MKDIPDGRTNYSIWFISPDQTRNKIGIFTSQASYYSDDLKLIHNLVRISDNLTINSKLLVSWDTMCPVELRAKVEQNQAKVDILARYTSRSIRVEAITPQGKQKNKIKAEGETYDNEGLIFALRNFILKGVQSKRFWVFNSLNASYAEVEFMIIGDEIAEVGGDTTEVIRARLATINGKVPDQYVLFAKQDSLRFVKSISAVQIIELTSHVD
ncbi:MAG: hypothetical protein AB1743_05960 [Actinomycetota bacterium]